MKIAVKTSIFIIGILLTMLILMGITSENARASESERALAAAIEQTLSKLITNDYKVESVEELLADFNQRLLLQINSDSDIQIDVLSADLEKGILDIKVTEKYKTMRGNEKEYICRKTIFLEEYADNHQKEYRNIRFQAEDSIYSQYSLYDGSKLVDPGVPEAAGKEFWHWKLEDIEEPAEIDKIMVTGDMLFIAIFK